MILVIRQRLGRELLKTAYFAHLKIRDFSLKTCNASPLDFKPTLAQYWPKLGKFVPPKKHINIHYVLLIIFWVGQNQVAKTLFLQFGVKLKSPLESGVFIKGEYALWGCAHISSASTAFGLTTAMAFCPFRRAEI